MSTQGKILVYKRENKKGFSWTYRIEAGRDPITGKRKQVTKSGFKTAKEARAAAQPVLNKLLLGENIIESDITFEEYAQQWLEEMRCHLKRPSIKNMVSCINTANKYFGKKKMKDITRYLYQQFINDYSQSIQKSSLKERHAKIKQIFSHAYKYNIIRTNPTTNIILPSKSTSAKKVSELYFTKDELSKLLTFIKNYVTDRNKFFYSVCMVLTFTGMRIGEVCALTWDDIDFSKKTISIKSSLFWKSYQEYERQSTPKNQTSIRTIKIGENLVSVLKKWKSEQIMLRYKNQTQDKHGTVDFVFTKYLKNEDKEVAVLPNTVRNSFIPINKLNLINKHIHPHMFRHTHVSLLAEIGIPLEVIQDRLGHSSDDTTKRIYLHITEKRQDLAAKKFEDYMLMQQ